MTEQPGSARVGAAEKIAGQVTELGRLLFAYFDSKITSLGLTVPQAQLLRQLDSPLAMNEVAGRLHCDQSNVTGIVDRLEARGFVERRARVGDRRVKEIALTADGLRMRRRVDRVLKGAPGIAALTSDEQSALRRLLGRALESIR